MLEAIAHPVALWALGLVGSLVRGVLRRSEETGKRVMPWSWVAANPGRAASAVVGSVILLAVLQRADLLEGAGLVPAFAALGAGAFGPEALPFILDKGKGMVRKLIKQAGK